MSNDTAAIRSLIIYGICLPLAIILGYLITDPLDQTTDFVFGLVVFLLVLPLLLRWYHAWLITIWNMSITFIFLPGNLPGWMPVASLAFAIAVGHYILNRERKFLVAPSVSWSLVFLALVVAVTAKFRGGLGFHAFGDESIGGKRYLWIWIAIIGYFALISQRVPPQKRRLYTTLFILGSITQVISEITGHLGSAFRFLYIFFPSTDDSAVSSQNPFGPEGVQRFAGVAAAFTALMYALVARHGIEGSLNLRKFWRPLLLLAALFLSIFSGFRSMAIATGLTFALIFCFEGLLRSRLMPIVVLGMLFVGGLTVCFSDRMPLSFQRGLAFLPLKLDPVARLSAEGTSEWRLEIWKSLLPQVPKYLLLGKGLTFDANDLASYVTMGNQQVGGEVGGGFALAGDYHNGPLSLIIPFGVWGVLAFLWFLVAAFKVLWANYKYGDPEIRNTNIFLLSYFLAKILVFFVIFGGFYSDLVGFVGIVGFSICLNNGVARRVAAPVRAPVVFNRVRPLRFGRPVPTS